MSRLAVSSPDVLHDRTIDAIIISAPTFHRAIQYKLERKYNPCGGLRVVNGDFRIVDTGESAHE